MKKETELTKVTNELIESDNKMFERFGWYSHYVSNKETYEELTESDVVDIHTHGLMKSFNHLNFQIVLPVNKDFAHDVFRDLVIRIKYKETFNENEEYSVLKNDYIFKLKKVEDSYGETLLRLIFADQEGLYPEDEGSDKSFKRQYDEVTL